MAKNVKPIVETPIVETPVIETPIVETTVVETPIIETPFVETPIIETPVVETPIVETSTEETTIVEDVVIDPDFEDEAETLMVSQNVKEIWRCPVKGYWFTKAENALDHSTKVGKSPEHYKQ